MKAVTKMRELKRVRDQQEKLRAVNRSYRDTDRDGREVYVSIVSFSPEARSLSEIERKLMAEIASLDRAQVALAEKAVGIRVGYV